jgi:hypothetical protein
MTDSMVSKEEIEALAHRLDELASDVMDARELLLDWSARKAAGGHDSGGDSTGVFSITSITPAEAKAGDILTISGSGFGAILGTVHAGNYPVTVTSWSDTKIVGDLYPTIPAGGYNVYINSVWRGGSITVMDVSGGNTSDGDASGSTDGGAGNGDSGDGTGSGDGGVGTGNGDASGGNTGGGDTSGGNTGGGDSGGGGTTGTGASEGGVGYVSGGNGQDIVVNYVAPQREGVAAERARFKTIAGMSVQMTAPVMTRKNEVIFTWNDPNSHTPPATFYGDSLPDSEIDLPAAPMNFRGEDPGFKNVELWTHNEKKVRMTPDASGHVSGTLDLSGEKNGPLVLDHLAWNSAAGSNPLDGNFRQGKQRFMFYVTGGSDYVLPALPSQVQALGLRRIFVEDFKAPLDISDTNTAAKWSTGKPEHNYRGDYGEAITVGVDGLPAGLESPYYQRLDGGGALRLRCRPHHGLLTDPMGWNREWYTGGIATGRVGGVGGFYAPVPYYARCRFLSPIGGVTWPAFWCLTKEALLDPSIGNIETDIVEFLGLFPNNYRAGGIFYHKDGTVTYGSSAAAQPAVYQNDAGAFEFHDYGCLVTPTQTTMFLDGVSLGSFATKFPDGMSTRHDFFMINNEFGGGWWQWQSTLPNSDHYDMWVSDFEVWGL